MEIIIKQIEEKENVSTAKMIRDVFVELDAPQKGTVYSDPTTDNLFELFKTPKSIFFVAKIGDEVVGSCGVYPTEGLTENCAEIVKFYLSKNYRGKGIGKMLMQKCFETAKEFKYEQLYLESLVQFSKAVGIYENLGFKKLSKPLGNSGHNRCDVWMIKDLN